MSKFIDIIEPDFLVDMIHDHTPLKIKYYQNKTESSLLTFEVERESLPVLEGMDDSDESKKILKKKNITFHTQKFLEDNLFQFDDDKGKVSLLDVLLKLEPAISMYLYAQMIYVLPKDVDAYRINDCIKEFIEKLTPGSFNFHSTFYSMVINSEFKIDSPMITTEIFGGEATRYNDVKFNVIIQRIGSTIDCEFYKKTNLIAMIKEVVYFCLVNTLLEKTSGYQRKLKV